MTIPLLPAIVRFGGWWVRGGVPSKSNNSPSASTTSGGAEKVGVPKEPIAAVYTALKRPIYMSRWNEVVKKVLYRL